MVLGLRIFLPFPLTLMLDSRESLSSSRAESKSIISPSGLRKETGTNGEITDAAAEAAAAAATAIAQKKRRRKKIIEQVV